MARKHGKRNGPRGPGLAKIRRAQIVTRRMLELVAVREGWWSSIIEHADVVSEGEPVDERDARVYYGSTSIHCAIDDTFDDVEEIAAVVLSDPHARLKMLRLAHREAVVRAGAPLNVMQAEMSAKLIISDEKSTLTIAIDVSAELVALDREGA